MQTQLSPNNIPFIEQTTQNILQLEHWTCLILNYPILGHVRD